MDETDLAARIRALAELPLNRHLGLVIDRHEADVAHAHFDVLPQRLAFGSLHGGALYALLDAVSLLALLPTLAPGQHAVTHDLHVSMMRAVAAGARCELSARVLRRGRTLAFMEATALVDQRLVASARVTKSLVAA